MKHIVIIGGGITGLAATHRVLERCRESGQHTKLTLLEASPRLGGIIQTQERNGFLLERGPDSFISEKPEALQLARRLGIESHLIETTPNHRRSFIVRKGRLLPVPAGFHLLAPARLWPFATSGIFSWPGKARIAMDLFLPRRKLNGKPDVANDASRDESLADFVRRRLGSEALERMAQPMVGGIYTADPEKLSLLATMPRFLEMEHKHRSLIRALRKQSASQTAAKWDGDKVASTPNGGTSGPRYSLFLSFDHGMQVFTDTLTQRILDFTSPSEEDNSSRRVSVQVNTAVKSLALEGGDGPAKWVIRTNRDESFVADAVCLAIPAPVSAHLLRGIDPVVASDLDGISYASSATINLAYKRADIPHPLDGFGFVVPFIERRSLIACTFSSVKFAGRAPEGFVLLRVFVGGALQPELLELNDAQLLSLVTADLRDLLGVSVPPLFSETARWRSSMPQYHLGHLERVKRIEERITALPSLGMAGNAYLGIGIPDCIRSGEQAAEEILRSMLSTSS